MHNFYLTSYKPLVATAPGRLAAKQFNLLPFIDGSIRREPDLEHIFPAITCLCHAEKFAPRLQLGDVVACMTRKGKYGQHSRQRRLTAILHVLDVFPSHEDGARWYSELNLPLPSNCMVRDNPPKPFEQSHQRPKTKARVPAQMYREWEAGYRIRARKFPTFVVCVRRYSDLGWSATEVTDEQLKRVFGKVPGTQNPGKWTLDHGEHLLKLLSLSPLLCRP